MPGILLSGPAGAGKSRRGSELLGLLGLAAIFIDFQSIYAALLGLGRDLSSGRYPERRPQDAFALPLAERMRQQAIRAALEQDIFPIVTNSDGSPQRRRFLLSQMGGGATEEVLDPGRAVVTRRLAGPDGQLSQQCEQAINRWYGRL